MNWTFLILSLILKALSYLSKWENLHNQLLCSEASPSEVAESSASRDRRGLRSLFFLWDLSVRYAKCDRQFVSASSQMWAEILRKHAFEAIRSMEFWNAASASS